MGALDESPTRDPAHPEPGRVGELIERITDDLKAIGKDELELARGELARRLKAAAIDAAVLILAGVVVLIAIGFVSVAVVDALAPVIPQLWLRLVIMAVVYAAVSGGLVTTFGKRLKSHLPPEVPRAKEEAVRTIEAVKEELRHA